MASVLYNFYIKPECSQTPAALEFATGITSQPIPTLHSPGLVFKPLRVDSAFQIPKKKSIRKCHPISNPKKREDTVKTPISVLGRGLVIIWRCDEVINLLGNSTVLQTLGLNAASTWVAVRASTVDGALHYLRLCSTGNTAYTCKQGWNSTYAQFNRRQMANNHHPQIQETNSSKQVRINYALEPVNPDEELPQAARLRSL
ncbi:hypothetical protein C8R46DRAFT_1040577 [Mycena filopes]|nr:hypothetical protein C8R46DRAFT_1040577 [Mycena filopes]